MPQCGTHPRKGRHLRSDALLGGEAVRVPQVKVQLNNSDLKPVKYPLRAGIRLVSEPQAHGGALLHCCVFPANSRQPEVTRPGFEPRTP